MKFLIVVDFTHTVEQRLQNMELQEKGEEKDEKQIGKLIRERLEIKGA